MCARARDGSKRYLSHALETAMCAIKVTSSPHCCTTYPGATNTTNALPPRSKQKSQSFENVARLFSASKQHRGSGKHKTRHLSFFWLV